MRPAASPGDLTQPSLKYTADEIVTPIVSLPNEPLFIFESDSRMLQIPLVPTGLAHCHCHLRL